MDSKFRVERDTIGEMLISRSAYYGIHSKRARENFRITNQKVDKTFIKSIAYVKKAAIMANNNADLISNEITSAVVKACDEIIAGKFSKEFITDPIQGGAGTSINMNANEVIANRALEILGHPKGSYDIIHPNDIINFGQSTNDVIPTSAHLATILLLDNLISELTLLKNTLIKKGNEFKDVIKLGRTHLQDAVPISLGQEFMAYARPIERDIKRLLLAREEMKEINMGATAVGTGLNADEIYFGNIISYLIEVTGIDFKRADDLVDATRNLDPFVWVSSAIKACAVNLSKMSNDLRLLASGPMGGIGEIILPTRQHGSSIMPGKINPVIPEVMNQICFQVFGNDVTITKAAEAGQLELNVFEPVLLHNLFQSIHLTANGVRTLRKNAIEGIEANRERCKELVERSVGTVTALAPHIGYEHASRVAKTAIKEHRKITDIILDEGLMSKEELDVVLDVKNMTTPGISGKDIMGKNKDI